MNVTRLDRAETGLTATIKRTPPPLLTQLSGSLDRTLFRLNSLSFPLSRLGTLPRGPRFNRVLSRYVMAETAAFSMGQVIGPGVGGILSEPTTYHPGTFSDSGVFGR